MGFMRFKRHISPDYLKATDVLKDRKKLIIGLVLTKRTSQALKFSHSLCRLKFSKHNLFLKPLEYFTMVRR